MSNLQGKRPAQDDDDNLRNPEKRRRSDNPSFPELLEECGCRISNEGRVHEYFVEDPRKLRRNLEQRLTLDEALQKSFLDGMREHLEPSEVLHAALKPMTVTGSNAFFTGDSLVRALLNIPSLQKDLSIYLLHRIAEYSEEDDMNDAAAATTTTTNRGATVTQAQLILGQFRWLDCLVDPHAVTESVLEVLPAMPPEAQRDAVTFLPEVAPEEDHLAVLDALETLVTESPEFLIPALEAASNLALNEQGQGQVTAMVASRLQSVTVHDLPAVVRHLLQTSSSTTKFAAMNTTLRDALHFVTSSDPRLPVADRKGGGGGGGKGKLPVKDGKDPESRVITAMRQALQFGKGSADAALKAVRGITTPQQHVTYDFWLMLALSALGPDRRRSVQSMLRKKFAEGHAAPIWLEHSISGHAVALGEQFSLLLSLAQHLLNDSAAAATVAGATLFFTLFIEFTDAYCRQEVLRALHSHLGAPSSTEATAALGVLQRLAKECTAELMQYAAFLTTILDYVTGYNEEQLIAAFDVFSELVVGACRADAAAAASSSSSSAAAAVTGGRSRMEDELFIFLRKQLSGAFPLHRRVGAVGVVALVQRLGKEMEENGGGAVSDDSLLAERYRESRALLDSTLTAAASCPDTLVFLCDALATEAQRGTLPRSLMEYLQGTLSGQLEDQFVVGIEQWSAMTDHEAWWNLNPSSDVAISLLPPKHTGNAGSTVVGSMVTLFPMLHAVAALNMTLAGHVQLIDALLVCPLGLFPMKNASPRVFVTLDHVEQRQVILGLFFALNWCRELINAFAPTASSSRQNEIALMLRVRAACQLEAILVDLLPRAPPLMVLPSLWPGTAAAGGASSTAGGGGTTASKAKGKKTSSKVKFMENNIQDTSNNASRMVAVADRDSSGSGQGTIATTTTTTTATAAAATAAVMVSLNGDLVLPTAERAKLRAFTPSSIAALAAMSKIEGTDKVCFSTLPPAAYLLSDVVQKARASLAQPKKSPFLTAFASKAAKSGSAVVPAATLLGALCPVLPALRHYLDAANRIADARMNDETIFSDEDFMLKEQLPGFSSSSLLKVLPDCMAAKRATSPTAAASRVLSGVLECTRVLFSYHEITSRDHRNVLQAVISAFGPLSASAPQPGSNPAATSDSGGSAGSFVLSQWGSAQFISGCSHAFKYHLMLAPGAAEEDAPTAAEMARWPSVLAVLEALLHVGEKLAAEDVSDAKLVASWAKLLGAMRKNLSKSAGLMLQQRWPTASVDGCHSAAEGPAGGWKGRTAPLSEAIRLSVVYSTAPLDQITDYVTRGLLEVTSVPTGKENSEPLEDWPSLSGTTLGTWYKCLWDALQNRWKDVSAAAKSSAKAANAAPEAVSTIAQGVSGCCALFNDMVVVVKQHERRSVVLNAAAKGGAVFLEGVLRVLPFWKEVISDHREAVIDAIKAVQKATRVLNNLCAEGKVRGDMNVVIRVSRLKKAIESFIHESYLLLVKHAPEMGINFGELKHRDLAGNALETSQLFPALAAGEEEEEEEEMEEDAGNAEEEEEEEEEEEAE